MLEADLQFRRIEMRVPRTDGAVLVVSAVEGVQAQTVVLHRALRRLGIPTLVFVNKIDRTGARPDWVLERIAQRLDPAVATLQDVVDAGLRQAAVILVGPALAAHGFAESHLYSCSRERT